MTRIDSITPAEEESVLLDIVDSVKAGFPSPAADASGERIDLIREMNRHPETTFYARVDGDSMCEAGILDGDVVVVDRSLYPKNGDFVIAFINGEFTLKEYMLDWEHKCAWLIPHNKEFSSIRVTEEDNSMIWGVVTHAVHSFHHKL